MGKKYEYYFDFVKSVFTFEVGVYRCECCGKDGNGGYFTDSNNNQCCENCVVEEN